MTKNHGNSKPIKGSKKRTSSSKTPHIHQPTKDIPRRSPSHEEEEEQDNQPAPTDDDWAEANTYPDTYTWAAEPSTSTYYPTPQDHHAAPDTQTWDTTSTTAATTGSSTRYISSSNPSTSTSPSYHPATNSSSHYIPSSSSSYPEDYADRAHEHPATVPQFDRWVNETSAVEMPVSERLVERR